MCTAGTKRRNVALKCGFFPDYEGYKENIYSCYGTVESEERFTITRGDYEWDHGKDGVSPSFFCGNCYLYLRKTISKQL